MGIDVYEKKDWRQTKLKCREEHRFTPRKEAKGYSALDAADRVLGHALGEVHYPRKDT